MSGAVRQEDDAEIARLQEEIAHLMEDRQRLIAENVRLQKLLLPAPVSFKERGNEVIGSPSQSLYAGYNCVSQKEGRYVYQFNFNVERHIYPGYQVLFKHTENEGYSVEDHTLPYGLDVAEIIETKPLMTLKNLEDFLKYVYSCGNAFFYRREQIEGLMRYCVEENIFTTLHVADNRRHIEIQLQSDILKCTTENGKVSFILKYGIESHLPILVKYESKSLNKADKSHLDNCVSHFYSMTIINALNCMRDAICNSQRSDNVQPDQEMPQCNNDRRSVENSKKRKKRSSLHKALSAMEHRDVRLHLKNITLKHSDRAPRLSKHIKALLKKNKKHQEREKQKHTTVSFNENTTITDFSKVTDSTVTNSCNDEKLDECIILSEVQTQLQKSPPTTKEDYDCIILTDMQKDTPAEEDTSEDCVILSDVQVHVQKGSGADDDCIILSDVKTHLNNISSDVNTQNTHQKKIFINPMAFSGPFHQLSKESQVKILSDVENAPENNQRKNRKIPRFHWSNNPQTQKQGRKKAKVTKEKKRKQRKAF